MPSLYEDIQKLRRSVSDVVAEQLARYREEHEEELSEYEKIEKKSRPS